MTKRNTVRITPRLIFGLAVLTLGVVFTLDNLGVLNASTFLYYWPLVFVLVGVSKMLYVRQTGAWLSSSLWIFAGGWWTAYNLEYVDIHPIELWPILLIVGGLHLVRRAMSPESRTGMSDKISGLAFCSGLSRHLTEHFDQADYTAIMGGCEVDLRDMRLDGEAVIDVFAFWGGIEIRVPETITVESSITPILGGFEDNTRNSDADPNQRLLIQGMAIMGGVVVRN